MTSGTFLGHVVCWTPALEEELRVCRSVCVSYSSEASGEVPLQVIAHAFTHTSTPESASFARETAESRDPSQLAKKSW